ncbi:MAG: hypothetical protein GWN58_58545 [Anaerolineae bacterium]|nr:hypothetical protein [Anaerolineae bacterium]
MKAEEEAEVCLLADRDTAQLELDKILDERRGYMGVESDVCRCWDRELARIMLLETSIRSVGALEVTP